jgi:hypothetical protein
MAYLLDPDSSREVDYGEYRVQEELGLAHVAQWYLGRSYPYRHTDIYDNPAREKVAKILAHDAGLIRRSADELPSLIGRDVGIGFIGASCVEERYDFLQAISTLLTAEEPQSEPQRFYPRPLKNL